MSDLHNVAFVTGEVRLASPPPGKRGGEESIRFGVPTPFLSQSKSSLGKKKVQPVEVPQKKAASGTSFNPLKLIKNGIKKILGSDISTSSNETSLKENPSSNVKLWEKDDNWISQLLKNFPGKKTKLIEVEEPKPAQLLEKEGIDHSSLGLSDGLSTGMKEIKAVVDSDGKPTYQISDEEISKTRVHIEENVDAYIETAKTKGEAILIHADESRGLHRSLVVTPEGDVFLLFNRTKKGDQKFFGTDKAVSRAIHLNTGELYASEAMNESYPLADGTRESPRGDEPYWREKTNAEVLLRHGVSSDQIFLPSYGVTYQRQKAEDVTKRPPPSLFRGRLFSKFCNQGTLESWVKKGKTISEMIPVFQSLALAIFSLHSNGIILRDLKLDNILMHENKCYIADIGTAGPLGQTGDQDIKTIKGCLSFLPPELLRWGVEREGHLYLEQSTRDIQNAAADMWALGLSMLMALRVSDLDLITQKDDLEENKIVAHLAAIKEALASLKQEYSGCPCLDIIERLLDENPQTRLTAEQLVFELGKISAPLPLPFLPPRD